MARAAPSKQPGPSYTFQRVHAALQTGDVLTVKQRRQEPMSCFMAQSLLDGACGLHVAAMLLVILNVAKASAMHNMSCRKYGVAAEVWQAFAPTYFTGIHALQWVTIMETLQLPLEFKASYGNAVSLDADAVRWLMRGDLVALTFASVDHQRTNHWALAVGVEGLARGEHHYPQRMLLLDPSAGEPVFNSYNARFALPETGLGSRRGGALAAGDIGNRSGQKVLWLYETESTKPERVQLTSAIRVRNSV